MDQHSIHLCLIGPAQCCDPDAPQNLGVPLPGKSWRVAPATVPMLALVSAPLGAHHSGLCFWCLLVQVLTAVGIVCVLPFDLAGKHSPWLMSRKRVSVIKLFSPYGTTCSRGAHCHQSMYFSGFLLIGRSCFLDAGAGCPWLCH